jgi:hypothetical protein
MQSMFHRQGITMRRACACLLTGTALVAGAWLARPSAVAQPPAAAPAGGSGFELRGAGSCAAAGCHNGNGPKGAKGSEYTTWVLHDPHARAFEVLYSDRSRLIEKYRHPDAKAPHPECDALCLNCHVLPGIEPVTGGGKKPARSEVFSYEDGVSCEACHGAAGGWLTQHYTASWRARSATDKAADGMRNTKDLRVRAEVCVRCHIGEGDLDVNHDLIAAGHPRLTFEYSAYLANLPKHWSDENDRAGWPDFEARVWALGQAVSAKAALGLLAHRADAKNGRPWPEFAEQDCFACHHDLRDREWRREPDRVAGRLGAPGWGSWYFPMLSEALGDPAPKDVADDLAALRKVMQQSLPDRKQAAQQAAAMADKLKPFVDKLERRRYDGDALGSTLRRVATDGQQKSRAGWDGAAQTYLALAALQRARGDLTPPARDSQLTARVRALGRLLEFPGTRQDSPGDIDPAVYLQALERVRQGIRK